MQFDLPKEQSSIIKVIGVGGGGSNAVNYMFEQGIRGVNFVICNTDAQAMDLSPIPNKIQLGPDLTEGLGAGSNPEIGRLATEESMEEVTNLLEKNTKMVFVTAGMGGGTGTGGAPVVAKLAREMGILTVGIATTPFFFEGRRKMKQAELGLEELRKNVDSLIIISNDKIREIYGNLTRSDAFAKADNILSIAAKSISEIITVAGQINVDFADVEYVMKSSGVSIMGSCVAEGEDRAARAIQGALASPLLNDNNIKGAQKILLNITSGTRQVLIDEITEIHEYVQEAAGYNTDVIFGTCDDDTLGDKISVTIIATGFEGRGLLEERDAITSKVVHTLEDKPKKPFVQPEAPKAPVSGTPQDVVAQSTEAEEPTPEHEETAQTTSLSFDFDIPKKEEPKEELKENQYFTLNTDSIAEDKEEEVTESNDDNDGIRLIKREEPKQEEPESFFIPGQGFKFSKNEEPDAKTEDLKEESQERFMRLRNLNMKMNNPNNMNELENEPAFKRRNIALTRSPHSSESSMSNYTLAEDEDDSERTTIKKNNSFLHDNVD